jgi:hypothetical protein
MVEEVFSFKKSGDPEITEKIESGIRIHDSFKNGQKIKDPNPQHSFSDTKKKC